MSFFFFLTQTYQGPKFSKQKIILEKPQIVMHSYVQGIVCIHVHKKNLKRNGVSQFAFALLSGLVISVSYIETSDKKPRSKVCFIGQLTLQ